MGWFVGVLIVDFVIVVFQAVSHSLASHHHFWRGPGLRAEVVAPRSVSALEPSASISPVGSFYSNGSPVFYPSRLVRRGRQAEASPSLGVPLLLCSEVPPVAEGSLVSASWRWDGMVCWCTDC